MDVFKWIQDLGNRNFRNTQAMVNVAHSHKMNEDLHRAGREQWAQVQALMKAKCGDNYQPPDEDMGTTFINSPIFSNEAIDKLIAAHASSDKTPDRSSPETSTGAARTPDVKTGSGFLKPALKMLLPLLIGSAVTIAATKYFAPEVPVDLYDIEAMPYVP
jgi:hypothetical protein